MIGKVMTGQSFRGCLLYCLNDKKQEVNEEQKMRNRAEVLLYNKCGGNERELVQQFNEVRALNQRVAKPVLHITLSLAEGEKVATEKLIEMSEACAKEMGFQESQYVAVLHHDTKHPHIHIVANRVGFEGRTVSESNSYRRIADYCRKMERQYGLQQVLSPKKFLNQKERQLPRLDQRKEQLRSDVKQCLFLSKNYEQFEGLMKRKKITIERGRGITFTDDKKMRVKGSELGYSLQTIETILAKKQGLSMQPTPQTKPDSNTAEKQSNTFKQSGINEGKSSLVINTGKAEASLLSRMMKPEQERTEPVVEELVQQIQKKKRRLRQG